MSYGEDTLFMLSLFKLKPVISYSNQANYYWYIGDKNSLSSVVNRSKLQLFISRYIKELRKLLVRENDSRITNHLVKLGVNYLSDTCKNSACYSNKMKEDVSFILTVLKEFDDVKELNFSENKFNYIYYFLFFKTRSVFLTSTFFYLYNRFKTKSNSEV